MCYNFSIIIIRDNSTRPYKCGPAVVKTTINATVVPKNQNCILAVSYHVEYKPQYIVVVCTFKLIFYTIYCGVAKLNKSYITQSTKSRSQVGWYDSTFWNQNVATGTLGPSKGHTIFGVFGVFGSEPGRSRVGAGSPVGAGLGAGLNDTFPEPALRSEPVSGRSRSRVGAGLGSEPARP